MKILLLANASGGLYGFRKELIYELLKQHTVYAVVPLTLYKEELTQLGVRLIDFPLDRRGMNPFHDFKLFKQYVCEVKRIRPDLVITYTIKPNIYGGIACRRNKVSYAVNITGLGTAFQKRGLIRTLVKNMYRIALKKAKVVFFENSGNEDFFIDNHIIKKEQACLLNGAGVNLDQFKYLQYPEDNNIFTFLFIGRIMQEKGIDELFAAMKLLLKDGYQCKLNVVGRCEENYEPILKQHEQEGWLKYYGYQTDVIPYIRASHCFVLPSWHEGMANTNLECAASGRPLITSNIPGCKEAVIEEVSGLLCEPKNIDNLYQAMKKMIVMKREQRKHMGEEGRKHIEEVFDKRKVVAATVAELMK